MQEKFIFIAIGYIFFAVVSGELRSKATSKSSDLF